MGAVAMLDAHWTALEKDLKSLPIAGVQKKRRQAIDGVGHAGSEREDRQFVLTVEDAQLAVGAGFEVDIVAGFDRVAGGVVRAVVSVRMVASCQCHPG